MSERPPSDTARFENVDWESVDRSGATPRRWNAWLFGLGLVALGAGFVHEHLRSGSIPFATNLDPVDWLLAVSLLALVTFVAMPLARRPAMTRRYWRRLRSRPLGLASFLVILIFVLVGLVGPIFVSEPTLLRFEQTNQPPVWGSISTEWTQGFCVGQVTDGRCHGTWQHPLGTTRTGKDMVPFLVLGARTALEVVAVSALFIVPTGITVGLVAAYAGGQVETVLMRFAEILQTVPAVIIYLLFWNWNVEYRLLVLVFVFGLTSWGGLARLVRNQTRQLRERPFVQSAKSSGATDWQVIRWHLLPNVSRSAVTNVTLQVPFLVLTEAALSFIVLPVPAADRPATIGDPSIVSWGQTIYVGIRKAGLFPAWWIATLPSVALVVTVLAITLFGRSLSDVLDPRPR